MKLELNIGFPNSAHPKNKYCMSQNVVLVKIYEFHLKNLQYDKYLTNTRKNNTLLYLVKRTLEQYIRHVGHSRQFDFHR
jgi:hypothetical protein